MNKIKLIELNNELIIAFMSGVGTGTIELKNKKDKIIFMKIIDGMAQFFKEKNITPPRAAAMFYVILSIFCIIFSAKGAMLFYR
jgi:hypothetical protein